MLAHIKYWGNIKQADYVDIVNHFKNGDWSYREEAIKYCQLDCKILYDVLNKFMILVFQELSVNANKCLSLPALALKIYKRKYMPLISVYQLTKEVCDAIRESYSGGAVDCYIPHN